MSCQHGLIVHVQFKCTTLIKCRINNSNFLAKYMYLVHVPIFWFNAANAQQLQTWKLRPTTGTLDIGILYILLEASACPHIMYIVIRYFCAEWCLWRNCTRQCTDKTHLNSHRTKRFNLQPSNNNCPCATKLLYLDLRISSINHPTMQCSLCSTLLVTKILCFP